MLVTDGIGMGYLSVLVIDGIGMGYPKCACDRRDRYGISQVSL